MLDPYNEAKTKEQQRKKRLVHELAGIKARNGDHRQHQQRGPHRQRDAAQRPREVPDLCKEQPDACKEMPAWLQHRDAKKRHPVSGSLDRTRCQIRAKKPERKERNVYHTWVGQRAEMPGLFRETETGETQGKTRLAPGLARGDEMGNSIAQLVIMERDTTTDKIVIDRGTIGVIF